MARFRTKTGFSIKESPSRLDVHGFQPGVSSLREVWSLLRCFGLEQCHVILLEHAPVPIEQLKPAGHEPHSPGLVTCCIDGGGSVFKDGHQCLLGGEDPLHNLQRESVRIVSRERRRRSGAEAEIEGRIAVVTVKAHVRCRRPRSVDPRYKGGDSRMAK